MSESSLRGPVVWWLGARPKTLPAAVVPVAVGCAVALEGDTQVWWRAVAALVVSLALQVGVNYANDYSDGVRGTDEQRVGPLRLVGSGSASASSVKRAAFVCFGVAACAGTLLALATTVWLIAVGCAAIIAAWTYTGGPRPYGYAGLGEVFVFVFFGVVATVGTQFVVSEVITSTGWISSVVVGAYACALLVINNLRDIPGDTIAGKRTLAVKMGDSLTRRFFVLLLGLGLGGIVLTMFTAGPWALIGIAGIVAARPAVVRVSRGVLGADLIPVLGTVGRAQLVLGVMYSLGLCLEFVL